MQQDNIKSLHHKLTSDGVARMLLKTSPISPDQASLAPFETCWRMGYLAHKMADKEGRAGEARLWLTEEFSGGDDSEHEVGGGSRA